MSSEPSQGAETPHLKPAELAAPAFYFDFWYIRTFGSGGAAGGGCGNVEMCCEMGPALPGDAQHQPQGVQKWVQIKDQRFGINLRF